MKPDSGHLDLERLQSADGPELHRALETVKQRLPDAQQLAALAASLSQIGIPVGDAATPASSATRLKLLLGAGIIGPIALALLLWRRPVPHDALAVASTKMAQEQAVAPSVEARPEPVMGWKEGNRLPASSGAITAEPSSAIPVSSASSAAKSDGAPRPATSPTPPRHMPAAGTAPITTTEGVRSSTTPSREAAEGNAPSAAARPTEIALLRDARLALPSNPGEALALTEQHRALYARGAMIQERELIAISALARLGRHTAVLARAAQFERDFPNSPYRKQVSVLAQ